MPLFKSKTNEPKPKVGIPSEEVRKLKAQGLSYEQIVQKLQDQGYDSSQIYEAINQVDTASSYQPYKYAPNELLVGQPPMGSPTASYGSAVGGEAQIERIEEIAEAIIDEKWSELLKNINKVIEWKEKTDSKLARIEQEIKNIKESFESLHKGILGKISEYDQNIINVGTELKAMQQVFKQILPTLTESVNKLSRIAKGSEEEKEKLTKKKS